MSTFQTNVLVSSLTADLNQIIAAAKLRYLVMPNAQLNWKPGPKQWSVAECLSHLLMANAPYVKQFENALKQPNAKPQGPVFQSGFLGDYFTNSMMPTNAGKIKMKMSTMGAMDPSKQHSGAQNNTVELFLFQMEKMLEIVERSPAVEWKSVRIQTFAGKWLTFSMGDAMRFVVAHTQRHLLQAERVTAHASFPK